MIYFITQNVYSMFLYFKTMFLGYIYSFWSRRTIQMWNVPSSIFSLLLIFPFLLFLVVTACLLFLFAYYYLLWFSETSSSFQPTSGLYPFTFASVCGIEASSLISPSGNVLGFLSQAVIPLWRIYLPFPMTILGFTELVYH